MNAPAIAVSRRAPSWGILAALALLACLALWFIQDRARVYTVYNAVSYGELWPRRHGFIPHMAGGLIALTTGLVQLWLGLTGRTGAVHRVFGRIYLGGVALGSAGGFYLASTIDPKYFAYSVGLFMLSVAWVLTTSMAYVAIRRRAIQQHREWMIRSYTVTFAFVTFRLIDKVLLNWHVAAADEVDTVMAWACWALPLLLVEPLLQLKKMGPAGTI